MWAALTRRARRAPDDVRGGRLRRHCRGVCQTFDCELGGCGRLYVVADACEVAGARTAPMCGLEVPGRGLTVDDVEDAVAQRTVKDVTRAVVA
jgi:hypothetical protein